MNQQLVDSAEEIRRSLRAFNDQARRNEARALKLLRQTTYWIYDPDTDQFGPGKFVGLKGMTFNSYRDVRHQAHGTATRKAIERVLDDEFTPRRSWTPRLRAWGETLMGKEAFGGADQAKWLFTSLRAKSGRRAADPLIDDEEAKSFPEGTPSYVQHLKRDRSAALVAAKKRTTLVKQGKLACEACGFDFSVRYGQLGSGYIECHHTVAVSELRPNSKTRLEDVALVCSNCHRMIHRKRPWLRMEEIRGLVHH